MSGATHHRRPGRGQAAQLEGCCARRGVGARAGWRALGNALALSCTGTFDRAHTRQRADSPCYSVALLAAVLPCVTSTDR